MFPWVVVVAVLVPVLVLALVLLIYSSIACCTAVDGDGVVLPCC